MKRLKQCIAVTLSLSLASCASVHPGVEAEPQPVVSPEPGVIGTKLPLKVSADIANSEAEDSFSVVYLTFENTGSNWVRIDNVDFEIGPEASNKLSVVVGRDLADWAVAYDERERLRKHNQQMTVDAILGGGIVAAALAGGSQGDTRSALAVASMLAVTGAMTYAIVDTYSSMAALHETPKKVPKNHVYQPFTVPGKLFTRRWVLVNKPVGEALTKISLKVRTAEGETERYVVNLR